ncbi:ABC transporter permease [Frankia sp. AgPm24]|uniref:ABC transporter permease n=1 Tax=Frankia sp. AgPm24 TaxID=631128 RepID=UPI00200EF325|nr:ABC transporter permease [Frankia sp. AgPm24]MCK9920920.1 ABC transporter permease [Frankia sp. AgPm24]
MSGRSDSGRSTRALWPGVVVGLVVLGCWEFVTRVLRVEEYILPAPDQVASTLVRRWNDTLASATWVTAKELVAGFALSLAAGLGIGCALHFSAVARRALYPLLIGSQTIPIVVIAPILAIVFGYGITPKLILVALICFFPVVVGTLDGLASVDPRLVAMMRTLHGGRLAIFVRVEFPAALPSVFTGLRLAAAYAATGAVFGEYSGAADGLGHVMRQGVPQLQSDLVFAAIVLLTAMSVALFALVCAAQRLLVPWHRPASTPATAGTRPGGNGIRAGGGRARVMRRAGGDRATARPDGAGNPPAAPVDGVRTTVCSAREGNVR